MISVKIDATIYFDDFISLSFKCLSHQYEHNTSTLTLRCITLSQLHSLEDEEEQRLIRRE